LPGTWYEVWLREKKKREKAFFNELKQWLPRGETGQDGSGYFSHTNIFFKGPLNPLPLGRREISVSMNVALRNF